MITKAVIISDIDIQLDNLKEKKEFEKHNKLSKIRGKLLHRVQLSKKDVAVLDNYGIPIQ